MKNGRGLWGVCAGLMLCAMTMIALSGCDMGTKVDLSAVDAPLRAMCARHDKYVNADATLQQVDKDVYLRTSALVIKALDTAEKKPASAPATAAALKINGVTGNGNVHWVTTDELANKKLFFESELELSAFMLSTKQRMPAKNELRYVDLPPGERNNAATEAQYTPEKMNSDLDKVEKWLKKTL